DAGLGYGFGFDSFALAPVLRFLQVVQPADKLSGADARVLMLGAEVTFFDAQPSAAALAQQAAAAPTDAPDFDKDGVPDRFDQCMDVPEDHDDYQDTDGCPEPDNDGDTIPDAIDKCPNAAEDFDNYEDG